MITVDLTNPDLLEQDRSELVEIVASANYRLEIGDFKPLQLTVETFESPIYRESRELEQEQFAEEIRQARANGDAVVATALEATRRSRDARAAVMNEFATQLWELLT
jgi:hypothetical protein